MLYYNLGELNIRGLVGTRMYKMHSLHCFKKRGPSGDIVHINAGVNWAAMQQLNIVTTVAWKWCADHSILMTSPLTTAPADGSHCSLATAPIMWAVFMQCHETPHQLHSSKHRSFHNLFMQISNIHCNMSILSFLYGGKNLYLTLVWLAWFRNASFVDCYGAVGFSI